MTPQAKEAIRHALGPGAGAVETAREVFDAIGAALAAAERRVHFLACQRGQVLRELQDVGLSTRELAPLFDMTPGRVVQLIKMARAEWPEREGYPVEPE